MMILRSRIQVLKKLLPKPLQKFNVQLKKKRKQAMDGAEEEIFGVLKVIAGKILESQPPLKPKTPTLKDCQSKLNVLGWLEDDPLYDVALAIFYEPSDRYREGWMQLKPERCAS
ncbi:hypothetical protein Tco_0124880 [Tanacetum coccineum]